MKGKTNPGNRSVSARVKQCVKAWWMKAQQAWLFVYVFHKMCQKSRLISDSTSAWEAGSSCLNLSQHAGVGEAKVTDTISDRYGIGHVFLCGWFGWNCRCLMPANVSLFHCDNTQYKRQVTVSHTKLLGASNITTFPFQNLLRLYYYAWPATQ